MQVIKHETENISSLFNEFDQVYTYTSSQKKHFLVNPVFDERFKPIFEMFTEYGHPFPVKYVNKPFTIGKLPRNKSETIIVCFSGGKDSIATVKRYQNMNYKVFLYHLQGINYTYKDEWINAQKAADFLQCPIYFDKVTLNGNHEYTEHPLKNMIIANGALQYGIREGIGTDIAFGNYTTSSLRDDNFDICGGDDLEMWELYENIMQEFIPDFKVHRLLENLNDTLNIFIQNPELIPHALSCIGPYRYKQHLRKNNQIKYGIELPENHCGSCWKCCLEYCVFTDKGILEYNKGYYKHCMEVLQRTLRQETGIKKSLEGVWDHYFFYDRKESKFWEA